MVEVSPDQTNNQMRYLIGIIAIEVHAFIMRSNRRKSVPVMKKPAFILLGLVVIGAIAAGLVSNRERRDSSRTVVGRNGPSDVPDDLSNRAPRKKVSATTASPTPEQSIARHVPLTNNSPPSNGWNRRAIGRGDKLRIVFYEHLSIDEDKWERARQPRSSFQQRMELSGEYTVEEDGTISLPLLGSISVDNSSTQELQATLARLFEKLMGRRGFVTVASLDRLPIYVLGPVKNPGVYKYAPAMTALHAVALAGGLDRGGTEQWPKVEAVRETERRRGRLEIIMRVMARVAVLKSERDDVPLVVPPPLVELATEIEAQNMLNEELERRQTTILARNAREVALRAAVENARGEVEAISGRIAPIDEIVKLREQRVNEVRALINRNVVNNAVLIQAQSELSDVQERRQDVLKTISLAKQRLALAEQERTRGQAEAKIDIDRSLEVAQQQIADAQREVAASEGVLNIIRKGDSRTATPMTEAMLSFEIVRWTEKGAIVLPATGTTSLEPGDLVRISSYPDKVGPSARSAEDDASAKAKMQMRGAEARGPDPVAPQSESPPVGPTTNAKQEPMPTDVGDQGKLKSDTRADAIAACEEIRMLTGGRDHNTPQCRQFDQGPSAK